MRAPRAQSRGFTLIELMIVLAIVAVLVALIAPKYQTYVRSANETSATASIAAIAKAEVAYAATCGGGGYAVSMADLAKPPVAGGEGFIEGQDLPHFIECRWKNSHIKSFAEMFFADLPMKLTGGCWPGQV